MENLIYIVFDVDGNVYGVYEEFADADDRANELNEEYDDQKDFHVEDYQLNMDYDNVE